MKATEILKRQNEDKFLKYNMHHVFISIWLKNMIIGSVLCCY